MKITISHIKSITKKNLRRIQAFYNALSIKKEKIEIIKKEFPKENLVREISFNLGYELEDIKELLINFLALIQNIKFKKIDEECYTLKVGEFLLSFFNEKGENLKIILR